MEDKTIQLSQEDVVKIDLPFVNQNIESINSSLTTSIDQVRELINRVNKKNTENGVSLLDCKNMLLSTYLLSISRFIKHRCNGEETNICGAIKDAATSQTILNKMAPIEKRIQGQIDSLIKSAAVAAVTETDVEENADIVGKDADDLFDESEENSENGNAADDLFDDDSVEENKENKNKENLKMIKNTEKERNKKETDLFLENTGIDSKSIKKNAIGKISEESLRKLSEEATKEFEKKLQEDKSNKALDKLKNTAVTKELLEAEGDVPQFMISGNAFTGAVNEELRDLEETAFKRYDSKKYRKIEAKSREKMYGEDFRDFNVIDDIEKASELYKEAAYTIRNENENENGTKIMTNVNNAIKKADETTSNKKKHKRSSSNKKSY